MPSRPTTGAARAERLRGANGPCKAEVYDQGEPAIQASGWPAVAAPDFGIRYRTRTEGFEPGLLRPSGGSSKRVRVRLSVTC
jgi:hypothetical protein